MNRRRACNYDRSVCASARSQEEQTAQGGRDTDLKMSQPNLDIKYAEMPHEIAVEFLFRSTRDQKSNAKAVAFIPTITRW